MNAGPPPLLKSAFDKLNRAKVHMDQLDAEFGTWFRDAYKVRTQANFQLGEIVQYVTLTQGLPDTWSGIVGDAVHDIRSALDHLVWALTVYHQKREPAEPLPPRGCHWRSVRFPIHLQPPGHWPPDALGGVNPALQQRFRNVQPFAAGKLYFARRTLLWTLEELWNRDKHRSVLEVGTSVTVQSRLQAEERVLLAIFGRSAREFPDIEVSEFELFNPGPIEHGKEFPLLRVVFDTGIPDYPTLLAYLKKNAGIVANIQFHEGAPAFGRSVRSLLRGLHNVVTMLIESFVPEFNPPRRISRSRAHCPPFRYV